MGARRSGVRSRPCHTLLPTCAAQLNSAGRAGQAGATRRKSARQGRGAPWQHGVSRRTRRKRDQAPARQQRTTHGPRSGRSAHVPISAGARKHFVDAQHVVRVDADAGVEAILANFLDQVLVGANARGLEPFAGKLRKGKRDGQARDGATMVSPAAATWSKPGARPRESEREGRDSSRACPPFDLPNARAGAGVAQCAAQTVWCTPPPFASRERTRTL